MKKPKPFTQEQWQEFDAMTADLSLAGKGAWIAIRMRLHVLGQYVLDIQSQQLARLLRCSVDEMREALREFSVSISCGLRVEYPPGNADVMVDVMPVLRLIYVPDEKTALLSSLNSLRVSKSRELKKNKEVKRMPEDWDLREETREYAIRYGMSNATVMHEFEKCKLHHRDNEWTDKGWESQVWQKWVLNWVSYGRKQVLVNGSTDRPPPPPPKNDPIGRGVWARAYGDPAKWGY